MINIFNIFQFLFLFGMLVWILRKVQGLGQIETRNNLPDPNPSAHLHLIKHSASLIENFANQIYQQIHVENFFIKKSEENKNSQVCLSVILNELIHLKALLFVKPVVTLPKEKLSLYLVRPCVFADGSYFFIEDFSDIPCLHIFQGLLYYVAMLNMDPVDNNKYILEVDDKFINSDAFKQFLKEAQPSVLSSVIFGVTPHLYFSDNQKDPLLNKVSCILTIDHAKDLVRLKHLPHSPSLYVRISKYVLAKWKKLDSYKEIKESLVILSRHHTLILGEVQDATDLFAHNYENIFDCAEGEYFGEEHIFIK